MGGLGALAGMLPGMKKAQAAMTAGGMDDKMMLRLDAIISSMTPKERAKPEIMAAKRKIRVANGAGVTVQEVNKLLKMHQEMATAMKRIKKMGGMGGLAKMMGGLGGGLGGGGLSGMLGGMGGGAGGMPDLAQLQSQFPRDLFKK
jgi:signal recognition particle subunit SRP54